MAQIIKFVNGQKDFEKFWNEAEYHYLFACYDSQFVFIADGGKKMLELIGKNPT